MAELTFERLERKPAYFTVADAIRRQIVSGELPHGSYLPPEHDFSAQLGVTRQTLREAVRLLETSGLITRGKRRRLVVSRPSVSAVGGSLREAMILHHVTYRELWELHTAHDPGVAALAARCIDEDDKVRLRDNVARTAEAVESSGELVDLDIEFHSLIVAATKNRALLLTHEANADIFYRTFSTLLYPIEPGQGRYVLDAHRRIADAILTGDIDGARLWIARHMDAIRRECEQGGIDLEQPFRPGATGA
jgi:DNA-binding FadR family transcriptional regulator